MRATVTEDQARLSGRSRRRRETSKGSEKERERSVDEGRGRVEIKKSDRARKVGRERKRETERNYYEHCAWPARGACCCVTPCCISRKERSQCASTRAEGVRGLISRPRTPVVNHPVSDTRVIAGSLPLLCPPYFDPPVIDTHRVVTNRAFL